MKKFFLLATAALALTACGTSAPEIKEQGNITLSFYKVSAQGLKSQDIFSDKTTNIRLRVSNPTTGFNMVKDVPVSDSAAISVPVPATSGYVVEAISYYKADYSNYYLKQGAQEGIVVQPSTTTNVNLVLARPAIKVQLPASVVAGQAFKLTLSGLPSNFSFCRLQVTNTQRTKNESIDYAGYGNGTYTLNAPAYADGGTMYAYAECKTEEWHSANGPLLSSIYAVYPDLNFGETPPTAALTLPGSGINIGIGY